MPEEQEDDFDSAFGEFAGVNAEEADDTKQDKDGKNDEGGEVPEEGDDTRTDEEPVQEKKDTLQDRLDAAETAARTAEHYARSQSGRFAAMQRELELARAEINKKTEQPDVNQIAKLAELREEYPQIAEPLLQEIANLRALVEEQKGGIANLLAEQQNRLADGQYQSALKEMNESFPEWFEIAGTQDFKNFVIAESAKSSTFRSAYEANADGIVDYSAAAMVFSLFLKKNNKQSTPGKGQPVSENNKREQQIASASGPRGGRSSGNSTARVSSDTGFDDAFDFYANKSKR